MLTGAELLLDRVEDDEVATEVRVLETVVRVVDDDRDELEVRRDVDVFLLVVLRLVELVLCVVVVVGLDDDVALAITTLNRLGSLAEDVEESEALTELDTFAELLGAGIT